MDGILSRVVPPIQFLYDAAELERQIAHWFSHDIPAGTIVEGSKHWVAWQRADNAISRYHAIQALIRAREQK